MGTRHYVLTTTFLISLLGIGGWTGPATGLPEHSRDSRAAWPQLLGDDEPNPKGKSDSPSSKLVFESPAALDPSPGLIRGQSEVEDGPSLFALVPDQFALTIKEQPTLYWYISKPAPHPVILMVRDEKRVKPLAEIVLSSAPRAGIHSAPLKEFNIRLELYREYRWFVYLDVEPDYPSRKVIASGRIRRIPPPESLLQQLRDSEPQHVTGIYSEAGFWYDAFASISHLLESRLTEWEEHEGRDVVAEQVDLMEVAQAEENITVPQDSLLRKSPRFPSLFITTSELAEFVP